MTRAENLSKLFDTVCDTLSEKLQSEECTPNDVKNAIQFLKDNGITGEPRKGTPLDRLLEDLPFNEINPHVS
jgi:hypothetical protein